MKYYVFSPKIGRTGSRRICSLLTNQTLPCTDWHIGEKGLIKHPGPTVFGKDNLPRKLRDLEDNTVLHAHLLFLPLDMENWTFILSKRNDLAQQTISACVATIAGHNPADNLESPITLEKQEVLGFARRLEQQYEEFKSKVDEYITIYLEDSVEEISEKLGGIKLHRRRDKDYISNNDYSKLITNYEEPYYWIEHWENNGKY